MHGHGHDTRLAALRIDVASRQTLAERGLRYDLVDTASVPDFDAWVLANRRGFHAPSPEADRLPRIRTQYAGRRLTGVWDDAGALTPRSAAIPVATIGSWPTDLTMPGASTIDLYAISSVTVSPAHAGCGIARAMVEGELRTASQAGFALAGLTVTESGLYARYGFGPAAFAARLDIETARAQWRGAEPAGSVVLIDLADAPGLLNEVHARARLRAPGDVPTSATFWESATGADAPDEATTRARRFAAHRAPDGEVDGVVAYRLEPMPDDFTKHTLVIEHLTAATDDAERALWRFVLRVPLVQRVRADLRPIDDPVRWLVDDTRAVQATRVDHHWLRILDVPRVLEARTYAYEGRLELLVHDALGFAGGRFALETDARGRARVARLDDAPVASSPRAGTSGAGSASVLELDVAALASIVLGGVGAAELQRADRLGLATPDAVELAERMFRVARAPWLSTWY